MMADRPADWADIVRERRKSLGRSQSDVADELGVTRQWVSNFENGRNTGSASLAVALTLLSSLGLLADVTEDDA